MTVLELKQKLAMLPENARMVCCDHEYGYYETDAVEVMQMVEIFDGVAPWDGKDLSTKGVFTGVIIN